MLLVLRAKNTKSISSVSNNKTNDLKNFQFYLKKLIIFFLFRATFIKFALS